MSPPQTYSRLSYARLFRPWDSNTHITVANPKIEEEDNSANHQRVMKTEIFDFKEHELTPSNSTMETENASFSGNESDRECASSSGSSPNSALYFNTSPLLQYSSISPPATNNPDTSTAYSQTLNHYSNCFNMSPFIQHPSISPSVTNHPVQQDTSTGSCQSSPGNDNGPSMSPLIQHSSISPPATNNQVQHDTSDGYSKTLPYDGNSLNESPLIQHSSISPAVTNNPVQPNTSTGSRQNSPGNGNEPTMSPLIQHSSVSPPATNNQVQQVPHSHPHFYGPLENNGPHFQHSVHAAGMPHFLPHMPVASPNEFYFAADAANGLHPVPSTISEAAVEAYALNPIAMNMINTEFFRIMAEDTRLKALNARRQRPKKFLCPQCDAGFSNRGQLNGHVRIHTGERPFMCKICKKTFTRNEELTRHSHIHTGIKPYPCPTCGKKFGRRDHLKKHMRTHIPHDRQMEPGVFLRMFPFIYHY